MARWLTTRPFPLEGEGREGGKTREKSLWEHPHG